LYFGVVVVVVVVVMAVAGAAATVVIIVVVVHSIFYWYLGCGLGVVVTVYSSHSISLIIHYIHQECGFWFGCCGPIPVTFIFGPWVMEQIQECWFQSTDV
jgi:hypothetical protein